MCITFTLGTDNQVEEINMGNYYSYELVGSKRLQKPNVYFKEPDMVESLLYYGYVESKRWDMISDMCRVSEVLPEEIITVDFTHEDSNSNWRVVFTQGKYVCVKSEFPNIDLDKAVSPNYESDRNTFDLT